MGKQIIGYTTGVFDLFHVGHVNILKNARLNCDFLIVGVTTDELSEEVKHKKPVIPFDERIEIVKSIRYVDKVVAQTSMDKMAAFYKYKFDVMIVGDDWKGTPKWNQLELDFSKLGVRIVYVPYTQHTSSSLLRTILEKLDR